MLRLHCVTQQYEWGKLGSDSAVARLKAAGEGVAISADKAYAEYWFGTHPSGPSRVVLDTEGGKEILLQDWLLTNPSALGASPYNAESALPYLLKVLSIAKALSVQAHPDRPLAAKLHALRPDAYKDANHKPEMAVALTPFEAMCSFRSPSEIVAHITSVPELRAMIGEVFTEQLVRVEGTSSSSPAGAFQTVLKEAYTYFMNQPESQVVAQTTALETRLRSNNDATASSSSIDKVVLRLCSQFPNDIGVFSPYLLNVITMQPGEAVFLAANEPHAYLSGDCVEVMACSDNVVRAGLTPKFKDVSTLCSMLTYSTGAPTILHGTALDACTREYVAPVPEFVLQCTTLQIEEEVVVGNTGKGGAHDSSRNGYMLPPIPSAAIVIIVQGKGKVVVTPTTAAAAGDAESSSSSSSSGAGSSHSDSNATMHEVEISEGQVWLQPAGTQVRVVSSSSLQLFRTHANQKFALTTTTLSTTTTT